MIVPQGRRSGLLRHPLLLLVLLSTGICSTVLAQQPASASGTTLEPVRRMNPKVHPIVEVATIKPSDPEGRNQGIGNDGNRIRLTRETLLSMVMFAYGVHSKQILGAPEWAGTQAWDVQGVADQAGEPDLKQLQELVAHLLADRFALTFHRKQRELPHWALTVAGGAPRMPHSVDPDAQPDQTGNGSDKGMSMVFTNNSMPDFVLGLQYFLSRPVVDETHLSGRYTFALHWTPDNLRDLHEDTAPGLAAALQEQLGLKLNAAKGPVEVIVIDRVEKPTPN